MNEGHEDRILDSFLEEMLTNQRPPDLTELIQKRLREELGPERYAQVRTGVRRQADNVRAKSVVPARPSWTTLTASGLTLAAGLMLSLAVWKFWPVEADSGPHPTALVRQPKSSDPPLAKNDPPGPSSAPIIKPQELPLPFPKDEPFVEQKPKRPPVAAPVAAMDDDEVVRWIDERFVKLWESKGLNTIAKLDNEEWLAQIANRLGGTTPVADQAPRELAEKIVRTAGFAENIADRIAGYWLQGTPEGDAKHPARRQLSSFVAQQIVARKPWNEVLSAIVSSQPDAPQSVWLTSLAGNENHRLAARVGSLMLDESLACARCHDASENGRIVSMDQDDYWSLVAMFSGVSIQQTKTEGAVSRKLVDNQRQLFEGSKLPALFFNRPDGRLQAVSYRLPGGDDWRMMESVQTPRESLARWIDRSSITDEASVNLAWRLVFGRPLVAQHAALDNEGYAQRREILSRLAEQFQAHNRDMGQLVTWLVSSRPFAQGKLNIDRSRWLTASEDEIAHWGNATANFAARLPSEPSEAQLAARSFESALASIEKWSSSRDDRRATLAQPTPLTGNKPKTTIKSVESEPLAGYLIHSVKPTYAQGSFINRLVKSKLSWDDQVDHIAGLVGEPAGNARLHSTAEKILKAKDGDRASALFHLLQGALLYHESL